MKKRMDWKSENELVQDCYKCGNAICQKTLNTDWFSEDSVYADDDGDA